MPESYLHKYAKVVLCGWIRKKIRIGSRYKGLNGFDLDVDFDWCLKNGPKGMCNVYQEYPVCLDVETKNIIGLKSRDWEKWAHTYDVKLLSRSGIPLTKELKQFTKEKKIKILNVFDVAVVSKEGLHSVYEILKTHAASDEKVEWLKSYGIKGYEIDASWIMDRVQPPFKVEIKRVLA